MHCTVGIKPGETLGRLRYSTYCKLVTKNFGRFQAERLPPSDNATHLHSFRVHLQAVNWASLGTDKLNAQNWGWRMANGKFSPVSLTDKPGPPHLMQVIRCNCSSAGNCSSKQCTCRKNGLKCIAACGHCHGEDCTNADVNNAVTDINEEPDETTDKVDELCSQDAPTDDTRSCDRQDDAYEELDNDTGCEFFFDSNFEAEIALCFEEVV